MLGGGGGLITKGRGVLGVKKPGFGSSKGGQPQMVHKGHFCSGVLFKFLTSTIVFLIREPHPSHHAEGGRGGGGKGSYLVDTCKV